MLVGLIGVHGVGKTYTARILASSYGFKHRTIEVIESAYGLDPVNRQLLFFSAYIRRFLNIYREWKETGEPTVIDTHPLLVVPYTKYWLPRGGIGEEDVDKIVSAMITLIRKLPKVDLLVYISPQNINTVLNRISIRKRFNLSEEHNKEYVEFINNWLSRYGIEIMRDIAKETLIVPAEWEGRRRAEEIMKRVNITRHRNKS